MKTLRRVLTPLHIHLAVVAVLAVVVLVLAVKAVLSVHAAGAVASASYQQQKAHSIQLRAELHHIQNLPQKVEQARQNENRFIEKRISPNYSTIAQELGQAAIANDVRLSQAQYSPSAPIDGIVEVRIDAGLSGGYVPMMKFINALERDQNHVFFIIDELAFTGQQGGLVNLRLRVSAYLQAGATDLPPTPLTQQTASIAPDKSGQSADGPHQRSPFALGTPALLALEVR